MIPIPVGRGSNIADQGRTALAFYYDNIGIGQYGMWIYPLERPLCTYQQVLGNYENAWGWLLIRAKRLGGTEFREHDEWNINVLLGPN